MIHHYRGFILKSIIVFLFGVVAYMPSQLHGQVVATGKPILIGIHGDRAKVASYYTMLQKDAIDVFVEEFNAAGGINGRPVKLLFEDDENNPVVAATKVEKLASQGVLYIVSIGSSATGLGAQAKANEMKIPHGAASNTAARLSHPLRKYYFRLSMRDEFVSQALVIFIKAKYAQPRVAVVRDATETGLIMSDTIIKEFKEANLNIVAVEQITPGSADVTAQAMRIKESGANVVGVFGGSIPDLANYVRTHKAVGNPSQMIGNYTFAGPGFGRLTGSASNGFIYTDSVDPSVPAYIEIEEKLIKKTGNRERFKDVVLSAQAWEYIRLVLDAIRRAGSDDWEAIRDAMEQTKNWPIALGPPGTKLSFSPTNHDFVNSVDQVVFREFWDGKFGKSIPLR